MKKLLLALMILSQLVVFCAASATYLNAWMPPRLFPYLNYLSLSFFPLAVLYFLMCIFWAVQWKKRGLLFLLLGMLLVPGMMRWINYTPSEKTAKGIKVISANILAPQNDKLVQQENFFKEQNADIIFLQETQFLEREIPQSLRGYHHISYPLISFFSKYPILKTERIFQDENGNAMFADVQTPKSMIRCVNVYLYPFSLDRDMIHLQKNPEANLVKGKQVFKKLRPVFKIHQEQIDQVAKLVRESPYPVILGGDFNAAPNSYEYFAIEKYLKDAFVTGGSGMGSTFHELQLPLKIDYLFSSAVLTAHDFKIHKQAHLSDHHPITAYFTLSQ